MNNLKISTFFLLLSSSMFAQITDVEDNLNINNKRIIEPAYRISEQPANVDSIKKSKVVSYPLLNVSAEVPIVIQKITPSTIKMNDRLVQLYRGYAKLGVGGGIGGGIMPIGEVYYNQTRSRKWLWGGNLKHNSATGNIKKLAPSGFDKTTAGIYAGYNVRNWRLRGDLFYGSQGLQYYGFEAPKTKKDSIAQRYTNYGINARFLSEELDSLSLNFIIEAGYYHFGTRKPKDANLKPWRAEEDHVSINTQWWYKMDNNTFKADFSINHNQYGYGIRDSVLPSLDSGMFMKSTVVTLYPHIETQSRDFRLKASVGLSLNVDAGTFARAYIYPVAEVKYSLFNDILVPYVGLRGGLKQHTFKGIVDLNPFVLQGVQVRSESKTIELYGGLKGTISRRISFNLGGGFSINKNKPLFVTDTLITSRNNQFKVVYDSINIAAFDGSLSYQLNEKFKLDGIVQLFSYTARTNVQAWNLPSIRVITRGSYNVYNKFLLNVDATIEGGRKGLVYGPMAGAKKENNQYSLPLGTLVDINLGLEYRYSKRVSAFLQLNNLASQTYKRFYNYPVIGIQAFGGITFRF
jgi:hypothetical protein